MRLTDEEITKRMKELPAWRLEDSTIVREYEFKDFAEAFTFMASAAPVADKMDHHPDWTNVYNKVIVRLTSHDEGGLTGKDFELAQEMDKLI
jgi:4a-hydroxytetrahydrobiopterin dehydratase